MVTTVPVRRALSMALPMTVEVKPAAASASGACPERMLLTNSLRKLKKMRMFRTYIPILNLWNNYS